MKNVKETLNQLSFNDLEKLYSLLADVSLILNPQQEKLAQLSVKGNSTALSIELLSVGVLFEMVNRKRVNRKRTKI